MLGSWPKIKFGYAHKNGNSPAFTAVSQSKTNLELSRLQDLDLNTLALPHTLVFLMNIIAYCLKLFDYLEHAERQLCFRPPLPALLRDRGFVDYIKTSEHDLRCFSVRTSSGSRLMLLEFILEAAGFKELWSRFISLFAKA